MFYVSNFGKIFGYVASSYWVPGMILRGPKVLIQ